MTHLPYNRNGHPRTKQASVPVVRRDLSLSHGLHKWQPHLAGPQLCPSWGTSTISILFCFICTLSAGHCSRMRTWRTKPLVIPHAGTVRVSWQFYNITVRGHAGSYSKSRTCNEGHNSNTTIVEQQRRVCLIGSRCGKRKHWCTSEGCELTTRFQCKLSAC